MINLLLGGSPCPHWSIAKTVGNREVTPDGIGWELFMNYIIAKNKFFPDFFLYENNKSMANPIKQAISACFGCEPNLLNSSLVSAQQRQRFYWCGQEVPQPEDRDIRLIDILENSKPLSTTKGDKSFCLTAIYAGATISNALERKQRTLVAEPIGAAMRGVYLDTMTRSSKTKAPTTQVFEFRADNKSNALTTVQKDCLVAEPLRAGHFATDRQEKVYEVKNGMITYKDKSYPVKLKDGYYHIRKLTITEACRLQTLPDDYCHAVARTQAYRGLGNGWTAEVIIHILNYLLKGISRDTHLNVLSMYDGIGTGRYCLDKMGFKNITYKAYEIDKHAIKVAMSNYPDIIQCGDAFQVRNNDWKY